MFANTWQSRVRRRGIVLVVILGMLALMALIGVTFATFSGQALINNRNFSQSVNLPSHEQLMDYALSQLINDTNNPLSSLRGHSLLRDMYGNDSVMRNAGGIRAYLERLPDGSPLVFTNIDVFPNLSSSVPVTNINLTGYTQYQTNIPTYSPWPQLYGLDFTRWVLRLNRLGSPVAQTLEVLHDDRSGPYHVLTLSATDSVTRTYNNPNNQYMYGVTPANSTTGVAKAPVFMNQPTVLGSVPLGTQFALDGRYMRAFNGPGLTQTNAIGAPDTTYLGAGQPHNSAAYGNFRTNGELLAYPFLTLNGQTNLQITTKGSTVLGNPNQVGMDEDYDACDLENWFMAIQSADGQVMIPSFHRPGILVTNLDPSTGNILSSDWTADLNSSALGERQRAVMAVSKILRPRKIDNSPAFPDDPMSPDPVTGQISYDVDNDGDGVTDSVWLDLGYPLMKDSRGKTFKPLFAFMVLGLNGRLPLNTVGNLHGRDMSPPTGGDLPIYPNPDQTGTPLLTYPDRPTWSHSSNLGYSVNEINPMFALQNACDAVVTNNNLPTPSLPALWLGQADNAGVDVATTQLRNILAGTVPQSQLNPSAGVNYNDLLNQERNIVSVQGGAWFMPNSLYDVFEQNFWGASVTQLTRASGSVPGRWGEAEGIPKILAAPTLVGHTAKSTTATPILYTIQAYENPVRAGRSFLNSTGLSTDAFDDDYDTTDFIAPPPMSVPDDANILAYSNNPASNNERWNYFDGTGNTVLPVERMRRFVTPQDPVGIGRVMSWNDRPNDAWDFGKGYDSTGRVVRYRYFRPPGLPQAVTYDTDPMHTPPAVANRPAGDRYNQAILVYPDAPNKSNNLLNGYWASLFPPAPIAGGGPDGIAVAASLPFDYNNSTTNANGAPQAYAPAGAGNTMSTPTPIAMTAVPPAFVTMTTGINSNQGPYLGPGTASKNVGASVINGYPNYPAVLPANASQPNKGSSLNKDEADEMNLYAATGEIDMPYGPSDLEWLYRKQDVDGAQLDSRLAKLAPISFLNPVDGATRRRLFSTDAWDTINFSYAFDNPNNAFPYNSRYYYFPAASFEPGPPTQQIFGSSLEALSISGYQNLWTITNLANPGMWSAKGTASIPQNTTVVPPGWPAPVNPAASLPLDGTELSTYLNNSPYAPVVSAPVAHRDRKINLNFPLPISNDPAEPVRQKWIRETYQFFKSILPPQAVDTPYELAQLSQYVVNIIDFRDPDCSTTRFVNTDIQVVPATSTSPANIVFAQDPVHATTTVNPNIAHYPFDPTIIEDANYYDANNYTPSNSAPLRYLVQHGMESSPIAINEVLAYSYKRKDTSTNNSVDTPRLYVELINTLTDDGGSQNSADIKLDGWKLVIVPDNNGLARPNPITGELGGDLASIPGRVTNTPLDLTAITVRANNSDPTILCNPHQDVNSETFNPANFFTNIPAANRILPNMPVITPLKSGRYFWAYLMRPANPFDPTSTETVVVDSFRFPYLESGGDGKYDTSQMPPKDTVVTTSTRTIWSMGRYQPYRGGHAVKNSTVTAPVPSTAYGYGEQTEPETNGTITITPKWGTVNPHLAFKNSIGKRNADQETWDFFPFHDRDFMSPAELLLVPGAPPGLFTKQFVELAYAPSIAASTRWDDNDLNNKNSMTATVEPKLPTNTPSVFPYLPDEFYYTAASVAPYSAAGVNDPYPSKIRGWTGAGWYKILEFVEVPSSANGSIGAVAQGDNFDWARQDVKPGQLNLNLIIDEEVYFGLLDDPRLNTQIINDPTEYYAAASTPPYLMDVMNFLPRVVTQIDLYGYPLRRAALNTAAPEPYFLGASLISPLKTYYTYDPGAANPLRYDAVSPYVRNNLGPSYNGRGYGVLRREATNGKTYFTQGMKASFSDFLKLRHGGSGFLFAWGNGATGQGNYSGVAPVAPLTNTPVAADRPFRSLSFPDINYTVMRPATLPPSNDSNPRFPDYPAVGANPAGSWTLQVAAIPNPPAYPLKVYQYADVNGALITPVPTEFIGDPGVKNPYLEDATTNLNKKLVPLIPTRRLFALPDKTNTGTPPSNAGVFDNTNFFNDNVNKPVVSTDLITGLQMLSTLSPQLAGVINPNDPTVPIRTPPLASWNLGDNGNNDRRQHPYYRTEMLQKVMNLTTVRTHQFAVWITIGFFEVTQPGAPSLAVPDKLGAELSVASGRNIRYRSFFVLDRTRAVGFSTDNPADFRDVVTYRRRIE